MKTLNTLVAAAALSVAASQAHATFQCDNPTQTVGATGKNAVVASRVSMDNDRRWTVLHKLADGTIIDRSTQYYMLDHSEGDHPGWWGRLDKNNDLWMVGEFIYSDRAHATYSETLYDRKHNNAVVMHSQAACAQLYAPEPQPAPSSQSGAVVALSTGDGGHSLHATIVLGSMPIDMLIDTGATGLSVSESVADALIATGRATRGADVQVTLADGSVHPERTIVIASVSLGGRSLSNVLASVGPDNGQMLLGMDILKRFGKFTIDVSNNQLILG